MPPSDRPAAALAPAPAPQSFYGRVAAMAQHHLCRLVGKERGTQLAAGFAMTFDAAARRDPKILECDDASVGLAMATAIMTGLQVGGPAPESYLIPRSNRRKVNGRWVSVQELQWMISWRGMVTLARRCGYGLRAVGVHDGDRLEHEGGVVDLLSWDAPRLLLGSGPRTWETMRGVVVVAYDLSTRSMRGWEWVDRGVIEARRDVSDAYQRGMSPTIEEWESGQRVTRPKTAEEVERGQSSPWFRWPVEMALKTGIRYAIGRALVPLDVEAAAAVARDDEEDRIIDVESVPVGQAQPQGAVAAVRAALAPPPERSAGEVMADELRRAEEERASREPVGGLTEEEQRQIEDEERKAAQREVR